MLDKCPKRVVIHGESVPQRLKPRAWRALTARLKPCPTQTYVEANLIKRLLSDLTVGENLVKKLNARYSPNLLNSRQIYSELSPSQTKWNNG